MRKVAKEMERKQKLYSEEDLIFSETRRMSSRISETTELTYGQMMKLSQTIFKTTSLATTIM